MKDVYTQPDNVITYVISATHRRFGAGAEAPLQQVRRPPRRVARLLAAAFSAWTARRRSPSSRMSRSTVHRAASAPC
ncbi:MAG: hypothetical protein ACRDNW_12675 [Trebonia sp.]